MGLWTFGYRGRNTFALSKTSKSLRRHSRTFIVQGKLDEQFRLIGGGLPKLMEQITVIENGFIVYRSRTVLPCFSSSTCLCLFMLDSPMLHSGGYHASSYVTSIRIYRFRVHIPTFRHRTNTVCSNVLAAPIQMGQSSVIRSRLGNRIITIQSLS